MTTREELKALAEALDKAASELEAIKHCLFRVSDALYEADRALLARAEQMGEGE